MRFRDVFQRLGALLHGDPTEIGGPPLVRHQRQGLAISDHGVEICFGAVLGGSVFGDQCSPISDTTILSSMFTGCDLMDHVKTQLPLALSAAGLAALCSTLLVVVGR